MNGRLFVVIVGLVIVLTILIWGCDEPALMTALKQRYDRLLHALRTDPALDPRWEPVKRRVVLTGMNGWSKQKGAIGYNVNKGYEIYVCMDGNADRANTAMHVLIHELCHTTVREYEHSDQFWKNFKDFKKYCARVGVYTPGDVDPYCGENIRT